MKRFLIVLMMIILSCHNDNKKTSLNKKKEIEPNNTLEYAQFIDYSTSINGKFDDDVDYYHINPTNSFIMDLYMTVPESKAIIEFELLSINRTIFKINTKDLLSFDKTIIFHDILLSEEPYYLKLKSISESKYNLKVIFKDNHIIANEKEPNNSFEYANIINYPNEKIYGYFIKDDIISNNDSNSISNKIINNIFIDEKIKPYIKEPLLDIDIYKIENTTDIESSINIIAEYSKDINIILFDKDFNYIKEGINKLNSSFSPNDIYYAALLCFGDKYSIDRYTLYYEFN